MKHFLLIHRARRYATGPDAEILCAVAHALEHRGHTVSTIQEEDIEATGLLPQADQYLSMARGATTLALLDGKPVHNTSAAIRAAMTRQWEQSTPDAPLPCWVKATDTLHSNTLCHTAAERDSAISQAQGHVVIEPHYEGRHVKFYAVPDVGFLYAEGTLLTPHSPLLTPCGLTIYGGDAVITADGTPHIIDINDWPSFAPCRRQAAEAIARLIGSN